MRTIPALLGLLIATFLVGLNPVTPPAGADPSFTPPRYACGDAHWQDPAPLGPFAFVDGAPADCYHGLEYDTRGITGTGTTSDPYVVESRSLDLHDLADHGYPSGGEIIHTDYVELTGLTTFAIYGEMVACIDGIGFVPLPADEVSPSPHDALYGLHVVDSQGIHVVNSNIQQALRSGILVEGTSSGNVSYTDLKYNYGSGARFTGPTTNWIFYGDLFRRDGWVMHHDPASPTGIDSSNGAGLVVEEGATPTVKSTNFEGNLNGVFIDQHTEPSTTVTTSDSSFSLSFWYAQVVYTAAPTTSGDPSLVTNPWTCNGYPFWWNESSNPTAMPAASSSATAASTGKWYAPLLVAPNPQRPATPPIPVLGDPAHTVYSLLDWWGTPVGANANAGPLNGEDVVGLIRTEPHLPAPPALPTLSALSNQHCLATDFQAIRDVCSRLDVTIPDAFPAMEAGEQTTYGALGGPTQAYLAYLP